jgi:trk system potassium uptake protein TrkA
MKVIIVGCGRLGSELAYMLYKHGNEVAIIDWDATAFDFLSPEFRGHMVEGDALSYDVLKRAGIETADGFAAVTSSDSVNLVTCRVATEIFHIKTVVARNFEPNSAELYNIFNLEVLSGTSWNASRLEEMILNEDVKLFYSLGSGEVDYYQVILPAHWDGKTVLDLSPNSNESVLCSITRLGRSFIPTEQDVLQAGDHLHFSATHTGIEALRQKLDLKKQEV